MPESDGSLGPTDIAILSARVDVARVGASRVGFYPEDVEGAGTSEPGEYIWKEYFPPTTQWTLLTEGRICGARPVAGFSMEDVSPAPVYDPPVADFNWVGPVTGGGTWDVEFTDTSTGDITAWSWDLDNGDSSTVQNPTNVYPGPGPWTVTLTVSGPGGSDVYSQVVDMGI
jgi:PKD repeat protein